MAAINEEGVVSLGVSIKTFVDAIKRVNTLNGTLFLGTNEGKILTHNNYLNASIVINDASVSVELTKDMDNIGNDHRRESAIISCDPSQNLLQVCRSDSVSSLLLALAIISVFLSTTFFILVISRGTRRGMFLSATLMKQMEATQQDERRSMNKILDASRIEVGKMQLHEEVFDSAIVFEEAVNFIYPWELVKVIDIVLDHCDSSVLKSPLVKGDRGKLKQVLNNLLSNAVKFTSEVHVVLRAWARKPNPNTSLLSPIYNVVEVNHTGKWIPKEKSDSIFENFVQIEGLSSSHVILVIQDDERKNVKKNFMRTPGVKVSAINQWEHMKRRFYANSRSSSGKFEQLGLYTDYLSQSTLHSPITAMYDESLSGNEQVEASRSSTPRRKNILQKNIATLPFVMIIIDDHVEPISEVCSIVANFRNNLHGDMRFQIVGLFSPIITEKNMRIARKRLMVTCDDIFIKLFHGSRLDQVFEAIIRVWG
ncbi:hypothetical protein MKW92_030660 [Papaver armeniacum]|nr:hypothetical protein MKW92_030660 [Papaver armeniacum]